MIASSRHDILKRQHRLQKPFRACLPYLKVLCDIFGSTLVLTPKPSTWKCKFDPEEKFLNSPARIKSRSNPVPQSFISSPAREKSKSSQLPQKFLSSPAREKKETARTGQNTCFQRSESQGEAESFNPNPSAGQEQETRAASKRAGTRVSHVRERTLQKVQRRWVTWTSAGAQRTEWIPTELPRTGYRRSSRTHSVARTKEGTHQPKRFPTAQPVTGRPLCDHAHSVRVGQKKWLTEPVALPDLPS